MSILNHLKKNESINDKQLVIFNSDYRDDINQTTSSFTYSFNEPIDRISKIEISDNLTFLVCRIEIVYYTDKF